MAFLGVAEPMCDDPEMATQAQAAAPAEAQEEQLPGESRWPPALALLVYTGLTIALRIWLPNESFVRVPWLIPAVEVLLLAVLIVGPANVARHGLPIRGISLVFVSLLVAAALWATALLVYDLIKGTGVSNSAVRLLASGGLVWLGNNLSFGLLYWLVDGGGPRARSRLLDPVDMAFTQHMSPEIAPPGWRPVFLDYLHLGFTNATAFSPTDVMPLTLRAKYLMLVHSTVALALFGLIVARAVNAFT